MYKKLGKLIFLQKAYYAIVILKNQLKRLINKKMDHKYLFILSPPYCGSTLLNEIISSSKSVSVNNPLGTREGQKLPSVRKLMFDHKKRWDITLDFDWMFIKNEWMKYWDLTFPVLLEKSPPNIMRASAIKNVFTPAYFVIFYRNPYAHCESLIRRNGHTPDSAAQFAIRCLKYQKQNIEQLSNTLVISYEELTTNPGHFAEKLSGFIPELEDINIHKKFTAHNFLNDNINIQNLNEQKIKKLSNLEIQTINFVFIEEKEILDYFKYKIIAKHPPHNMSAT